MGRGIIYLVVYRIGDASIITSTPAQKLRLDVDYCRPRAIRPAWVMRPLALSSRALSIFRFEVVPGDLRGVNFCR